jgi:demethylmenaquinone methyltransferase/2-methoxy-6-polyprenyl-1,4-benzoquinol methylase
LDVTGEGAMGEEMADFGFRRVPAREKAGYVRRHFNSVVGTYDFMNTLLSLGIHHLWKRAAVRSLGLTAGERVIDVCGGTADLSLLAARAVGPLGRVVLTDINRAMIAVGAAKVGRAALSRRIVAVQGDAESLPFPAESFDAAIVGFGIRNLTRMERGMAEMHRVLRPGGRMTCLECSLPVSLWFGPLYNFYSFRIMPLAGKWLAGNREAYLHLPESIKRFPPPERIAALFGEAGFSAVAYRRLTKGIAVIYTGIKR